MPDLSDADPVAVVVAWLTAHPVAEALGGAEHISGALEAPWTHVIVGDGDNHAIRRSRWSAVFEVALEVVGHPNGAPGQAELWRTAMKVLNAVCELGDEQQPAATEPVVSLVEPSGGVVWAPMSNGQPRYTTSVAVTLRPPVE